MSCGLRLDFYQRGGDEIMTEPPSPSPISSPANQQRVMRLSLQHHSLSAQKLIAFYKPHFILTDRNFIKISI